MKRYFLSALAVILLILFNSSFTEAATQPRLAVINLSDINSELAEQSEIVAGSFTGVLAKSKALIVVERDELELIMREQKIKLSEPDSPVKLGKILNCQYMVLSSLTYEQSPIIAVRVVDVKTSEIIFSDTELSDSSDNSSIIAASSRLADKVLEFLVEEQAVIVEINNKEITINRGSSSGVRIGDLYRVYVGTARNQVNLAIIKVKDIHASFSITEIIKKGGDISSLRKADKIEAISKKEADSLIKRKKLAKKRPGESKSNLTNSTLKKVRWATDDNDDFIQSIEKAFSVYEGLEDAARRRSDPERYNETGDLWRKLGNMVSGNKEKELNELERQYRKLDVLRSGTNSSAQQEIRERIQRRTALLDEIIEECYASAIRCFNWSVRQNHADGKCKLGAMYLDGVGVAQNYVKATELFRQAAEQGSAKGENSLANMYYKGLGVKQDIQKAIELLHKSAEHGFAMAQYNLGDMYLHGLNVKQDYKKAAELLEKAAAQGNKEAQNSLGFMYFKGFGVKQSYAKAFELFSQSAAQGDSMGLLNLVDILPTPKGGGF